VKPTAVLVATLVLLVGVLTWAVVPGDRACLWAVTRGDSRGYVEVPCELSAADLLEYLATHLSFVPES
jgi:hypothetical protein